MRYGICWISMLKEKKYKLEERVFAHFPNGLTLTVKATITLPMMRGCILRIKVLWCGMEVCGVSLKN